MKRTTTFLIAALLGVLTLAPAPAFALEDGAAPAAHADDHGAAVKPSVIAGVKQGVIPAVTALIAFAVVFGIGYTQIWPKIVKGLDDRAAKIAEEIESAEAARKQAKDALDEYEQSLADARAESQQMLDAAKAKQAEVTAQLKAKADAELGAMRERALKDIEAAKKQALTEIYNESVNLAAHMAGKILQREVTPNDQQRLVEESLAELNAR